MPCMVASEAALRSAQGREQALPFERASKLCLSNARASSLTYRGGEIIPRLETRNVCNRQ